MGRLVVLMLALAALWLEPAQAARRAEVVDKTDLPATGNDGKPLDLARTRAAILVGARRLNFQVKKEEPGLITVEYRQSSGQGATMDLPYEAGKYSILYVSSEGMRAKESATRRTIHSSYARWVKNLAAEIDKAARSDPSGGNLPDPPREEIPPSEEK